MDPRVAVVSGGSSGIGRAIVAQLHRDGWVVHVCARDATKLEHLERDFPGVRTRACDVADRMAVRAFASAVAAESRTVDLLVANAGGLTEIDFASEALADIDVTAELRVNTGGAIHMVAEFLPALGRSSAGAILVVSSGYALVPATRAPVYSASKAALHSFSKALRRQLAPAGIRVTELLPPLVDTPAVAHRKGAKLPAEAVAGQALAGVAAGRHEVRPGPVKFLPLLLRLMPDFVERAVAKR